MAPNYLAFRSLFIFQACCPVGMMKGRRTITHSLLRAIYSYPCECKGNLGVWGSGHPTQDHRCLMIGSKRKKGDNLSGRG